MRGCGPVAANPPIVLILVHRSWVSSIEAPVDVPLGVPPCKLSTVDPSATAGSVPFVLTPQQLYDY